MAEGKFHLAITTVTYNDRATLLEVVAKFLAHTKWNVHIHWYMALQNCSDAFFDKLLALFASSRNITFVPARFKENLGLSKAMAYLVEQTKEFEFTLNLEDDWILLDTHAQSNAWLNTCLEFLHSNPSASAVFLRAYAGEKDKFQYGWTRTIPYLCHEFKDNFNYEKAMQQNKQVIEQNGDAFQLIPNFLFTFNPVLVRNRDYHKHVYPIPILQNDQKDPKHGANWGCCEAVMMERTRKAGLLTYWFKNGVFGHFEDFFT